MMIHTFDGVYYFAFYILFPPAYRKIDILISRNKNEPVREKTNILGFRPGLIQTRLYSHRSRLEA